MQLTLGLTDRPTDGQTRQDAHSPASEFVCLFISQPLTRLYCANKVGIYEGLVRSAAEIRGIDRGKK